LFNYKSTLINDIGKIVSLNLACWRISLGMGST